MGKEVVKIRGLLVVDLQCPEMFLPPIDSVVDPHLIDVLRVLVQDGHGEPHPSLGRLYLISILKLVFLELDVIEENKDIAPCDFVKVPQPRHKLGLMYRCHHARKSSRKEWRDQGSFIFFLAGG